MSVESPPQSASLSSEMVAASSSALLLVVVPPSAASSASSLLDPPPQRGSMDHSDPESPSIIPTGNNNSPSSQKKRKMRKKKNPQLQHSSSSSTALPAMTPTKMNNNTTLLLAKHEHGRLKKLLKRALHVDTRNSVSGITQYSEWRELQYLWQRSGRHQNPQQPDASSSNSSSRRNNYPLAPRLSRKRGSGGTPASSSDLIIDAASHRDLLRRLVLTLTTEHEEPQRQVEKNHNHNNSNKKKRKRNQQEKATSASRNSNSSSVGCISDRSFAWASLHNPFAVASVGVLELHVDTVEAVEWLQQKLQDLISQQHHVVTATTSWFQPSRIMPQSIADRLLYKPPATAVKLQPPENDNNDDATTTTKRRKMDESTAVSTLQSLVEGMNPLILTRQQLEQNGYPLTAALHQQHNYTNDERNSDLWDQPLRPQDISLAEATAFVLNYQTKTEMMDPQIQLPPFVMAPCASSSQSARDRQVFAMDAEMVETNEGRELARITLVRLQPPPLFTGSHQQQSSPTTTTPRADLVFDVLVRPRNTVTNYWTQYSGVTAAMLHDDPSNGVVQLEQVQAALLRTIHPDDLLVGHSLENDLRATRFLHETVVDTAVIFQKKQGQKLALRHLAAVLLNQRIQQSDRGHCSEEDAVTALHLAVRRAVEGPAFDIHSSPTPTNWLAELPSSSSSKNSPNTVVAIGPSEWLERHVLSAPPNGLHALQCDSVHDGNAQALASWLTGPRRRAEVVYASFRLPPASRSSNSNTSMLSSDTEATPSLHLPDVNKLFERLTCLLQKLPPEAMLLLAIQPGYAVAHQRTQLRNVRRNNPKATLGAWTESEEEEWRRLVQSCRMGSVLWVSSK